MTDGPIKTGAIPNCQCHQRIAQLESALEILAGELKRTDDCPDAHECRQLKSKDLWDNAKCVQCWIDWAMEEAKK